MARKATGQVICRRRKTGTYYRLRITLPKGGGRRSISLGPAKDGWNWQKATDELDNVLADVRRGIWRPPEPAPIDDSRELPTFHEFASQWSSVKSKPIIDEYTDRRGRKYVRPRRSVSAGSVNKMKTIATLAAILEDAVEYELIQRNVARGRRRRPQTSPTRRPWLDRAEHISALLDAAAELDKSALTNKGRRRALLATLVFAGLRIDEALSLRWRTSASHAARSLSGRARPR